MENNINEAKVDNFNEIISSSQNLEETVKEDNIINKGIISHVEYSSKVNGPGLRSVLYLKGCPLNCIWCNTPQLIEKERRLLFNKKKCTYCFKCSSACTNRINAERENLDFHCLLCGNCVEKCPSNARYILGKEITAKEIVKQINDKLEERSEIKSLTLSGGEPFYQSEFSLAILKEAKAMGFNTCIETCGHAHFTDIYPSLDYLDYIIYDLKFFDNELHKDFTGEGNETILENLELILDFGKEVIIRVPIITDINDSVNQLKEIAKYLSNKDISKIEIIPFSFKGMENYSILGSPMDEDLFKIPPSGRLEKIKQLFLLINKNVEIINL